jgi:5,10-methylenetetrahydromethanopterin reductase
MREPTYVAQLAATLDELSDGRAEVVFGIGNIAMLEHTAWSGVERARSPGCARRTK